MTSARVPAHIILIALVVGVLSPASFAQNVAGTANLTSTTDGMATPLGGQHLLAGGTTDVILGKNAKGPYLLSWKPVKQNTEQVFVNGRRMQRGTDYTIDYAAGVLAFTLPADQKAIIRVEYSYDPAIAVRNNAPLSVPLTLDLLRKQDASLQFTGLFKQADPNAPVASGVSILGLTGEKKAKEGAVSSMFLMSTDRSLDRGGDDPSFMDRSALKLGGSTTTDTLRLSTTFLRVGERFAGAKEYKLQQGQEAMDILAEYNPNRTVSVTTSFKHNEFSAGEKKGESLTSSEQKLVLTPDGAPKLTLTHATTDKTKSGGAQQSATTDRIQLEQKLGDKVSAVATHESVTTEVGGQSTDVTTNQLALDAQASRTTAIKSVLTQRDSSATGKELGMSFDVNATPSRILTVKAAVKRLDAEKTGQDNSESIRLAVNPSARLSVQLDMAHRSADESGKEFGHMLKVISNPAARLSMEFMVSANEATQPRDESARTFKLSSSQFKNVKVELDYASLDSEVKGAEEIGQLRVEAVPAEKVKVSAALAQKEAEGKRDVSKEAKVELKPFSNTTVGGGYKQVETDGSTVASITEVSASTKPTPALEFSGAYKQREALNEADLDSLNLALALEAGRWLKFTGSYVTNPEDKRGMVQRTNSQVLGLVSDLGWMKLRGAYSLNDSYLLGKASYATEVGVDFRLSSRSTLMTGYKQDAYREQDLTDTSVYSVGFSRNVGNDFSLYLGGKMTTYERDRIMLRDQTHYEAEAKLGLRF